MAVGTEFRVTAQGIQQALGPAVPNANDTLVVPAAAEVLPGALIRASRVGRKEALRMQEDSPMMALAPGMAAPVIGLTIVVKAPVGPIEKHITLALAVALLEMAILMFMCFDVSVLAPNASRLLVWADIRIRLAPRVIVEIRASGLLLGLPKSSSVPVAQSVFRLILTLGGALNRMGVRPFLLPRAMAIAVEEARLWLLETLQAKAMAFVDVVEVLSRRHWLLQTGETAMLPPPGVLIPATPSME